MKIRNVVPNELKAYMVGDVIECDGSMSLVVVGEDGHYAMVDILKDTVSPAYQHLDDLYADFHDENDRLVDAELLVKGVLENASN